MPPTDLSAYCRPVNTPTGSPPPRPPPQQYGGGGGGGPNSGGHGGYHERGPNNFDDNNNHETNNNKTELKRKCIDYHTPAVFDVTSRLYRKPNSRLHTLPGGSGRAGYPYIQCHTNYLKLLGLPCGEGVGGDVIPSMAFLTYCAHVTRAKNSNPVM